LNAPAGELRVLKIIRDCDDDDDHHFRDDDWRFRDDW
jgi:hypothetical protein